jgi:hypothetical protein
VDILKVTLDDSQKDEHTVRLEMTRTIRIATAALVLLSLHASRALAAEKVVITLSCDGTLTDARSPKREPLKINNLGVVVNLAEETVSFGGYVTRIDKVDAANISFNGTSDFQFHGVGPKTTLSIWGAIDRVTGAMSASTNTTAETYSYELLCKPANRVL